MRICTNIFELEYGDVFKSNFEKIEKWLVGNDATLKANKNKFFPLRAFLLFKKSPKCFFLKNDFFCSWTILISFEIFAYF